VIPLPVIFAGVAAIAGFTSAWQIQGVRHEAQLAQLSAAHATAMADAANKAHTETIRLQALKNEAERKAAIRIAAVRRDADAASSALTGLSHAADSALRSASGSHSACLADANTLTIVFGRCTAELQSVATDADQLTSNVQTLIESWPSAKP
jgi:hypothetical protein